MTQNVNDTTELTLTLQIQEINAIINSLQELPAKVANPLTKKLMDQASAQIQDLESGGKDVQVNVEDGASAKDSLA